MIRKSIGYFIVLSLFSFLPVLINKYFAIEFYFDAGYRDFQSWFPNYHLLVFLFFKLYHPLLYIGWVLYLHRFLSSANWYILFGVAGLSCILVCEIFYAHIFFVIATDILLSIAVAVAMFYVLLSVLQCFKISLPQVINSTQYWGVFVIYIVISFSVSEFHPFSRYPMYSHFPNYAYVFMIRDGRDHFVPSEKYFRCTGNSLSHLYSNICERRHYDSADTGSANTNNAVIGKEMFQYILTTQTRKPDFDSLSVNRICYKIENGKITANEIQLYKGKLE